MSPSLAGSPMRRIRALTLLGFAGAIASCQGATGPGSTGNCDPNPGFNFLAPSRTLSYQMGTTGSMDLIIQRDTAQGPIHFDVLRGMRRYGSGEWQDTLALQLTFSPNPVLLGTDRVRLDVSSIGLSTNTFANETMYVRGFIGNAALAKECYRLILLTVTPP